MHLTHSENGRPNSTSRLTEACECSRSTSKPKRGVSTKKTVRYHPTLTSTKMVDTDEQLPPPTTITRTNRQLTSASPGITVPTLSRGPSRGQLVCGSSGTTSKLLTTTRPRESGLRRTYRGPGRVMVTTTKSSSMPGRISAGTKRRVGRKGSQQSESVWFAKRADGETCTLPGGGEGSSRVVRHVITRSTLAQQ